MLFKYYLKSENVFRVHGSVEDDGVQVLVKVGKDNQGSWCSEKYNGVKLHR